MVLLTKEALTEGFVLVLCHGNINRSPLCEATLNYFGVNAHSAGFGKAGLPPAKRVRDYWYGLGLGHLTGYSMEVTPQMIAHADLVIYMDSGNKRRLDVIMKEHGLTTRTQCLGDHASPVVSRIPDPAFMTRNSPEEIATLNLIFQASFSLAKKLVASKAILKATLQQ